MKNKMYTVDDLRSGLTSDIFTEKLRELIQSDGGVFKSAGYHLPDGFTDRNESHQFTWGHNHDFTKNGGTEGLRLIGRMGNRHIELVDQFVKWGANPNEKRILDVGCWTGGASLYLSKNWDVKEIIAIDEVEMYVKVLSYLDYAFNSQIDAYPMSVYHIAKFEKFDLIFFAGVLYHLSDPIVALRKLWEMLADDGLMFIETEITKNQGCVMEYRGPTKTGWNWFFPSTEALYQMLHDTGFEIQYAAISGSRAKVMVNKIPGKKMMSCGLNKKFS